MDTVMTPRVAATLDRRALATLSEGASIAIKREVHELVVSAPAPAFAAAFRAVMMARTALRRKLLTCPKPIHKTGCA